MSLVLLKLAMQPLAGCKQGRKLGGPEVWTVVVICMIHCVDISHHQPSSHYLTGNCFGKSTQEQIVVMPCFKKYNFSLCNHK